MKVALGAAKGLAFLHSADTKVIYRDFKASNILIDSVSMMWITDTCPLEEPCRAKRCLLDQIFSHVIIFF